MATHSSILAWRIPWTEESGGLQSIGSQRVRHNLAHTQSGIIIIRIDSHTSGGKNAHILPSVSQRLRTASGVIKSESKGLRTRGDVGVVPQSEFKCPRNRSTDVASKAGEQSKFVLPLPFCTLQALNGLDDDNHCISEGYLLSSV